MDFHPVEDYGVTISVAAEKSFKGPRCMTPVSNQGNVYACVFFSVSDAVSAKYALNIPQHIPFEAVELSKQELLDCTGCNWRGAYFEYIYEYIRLYGLHFEVNYPYIGQNGLPCRCFSLLEQRKIGIKGYKGIVGDEAVMDALHDQPVTAGMYVYDSFLNRGRTMDVYANLEGEIPKVDEFGRLHHHAVLVTGHGSYNDEPYYIIKNSKGINWGVNGYTRIAPRMLFYYAFPTDAEVL